jgi:hypothetical protein
VRRICDLTVAVATISLCFAACGRKTEPAQQAAKPTAKGQPAAGQADPSAGAGGEGALMSKEEVVFDPRNPPLGFTICHRNHCHRVGGGVASYQQVMAEIGATKAINVPKRGPMPKAPADVATPPANAERTASGLASVVLKPGVGPKPGPKSVVMVHYTGWTTDGRAFDSSVARGQPATFPLDRIIKGWGEGVQLMSVGEERRLWIPEALAFQGRRGAPPGMLVFDVELLGIR